MSTHASHLPSTPAYATKVADEINRLPGVTARFASIRFPMYTPGSASRTALDIRINDENHSYAILQTAQLGSATVGVVADELRRIQAALEAHYASVSPGRGSNGIRGLILSGRITREARESLGERGIEYADASGNIHLHGPGYVFFQEGKRQPTTRPRNSLTPSVLTTMYVLLAAPELLKATQREIATAAAISVGSVSNALKDLRRDGSLLETRSGNHHWTNEDRTRRRWEVGYADRLRAKLRPSNWRLSVGGLADIATMVEELPAVLLGGEFASAMLGAPLRPAGITLYAPPSQRREIAVKLRLVEEHEIGTIHLLDTLAPDLHAQSKSLGSLRLAPPLLVRAELLALDDERLDTAAAWLLDHRIHGGAHG